MMYHLILQVNFFESREQKLKEKFTYYADLPGQFKDEAMYEWDILTDNEELETDQFDTEDSSDVFICPAVEIDFV